MLLKGCVPGRSRGVPAFAGSLCHWQGGAALGVNAPPVAVTLMAGKC